MKTEKMSFRNIKDVLSRDEMKSIMAGSGLEACGGCQSPVNGQWAYCVKGGNLTTCTCMPAPGYPCHT
ncbi:MAG: hypothetical protein IT213_11265 [Cytophagales bacterium]|nr:hypothetical protein [Cytophagales bacterium]